MLSHLSTLFANTPANWILIRRIYKCWIRCGSEISAQITLWFQFLTSPQLCIKMAKLLLAVVALCVCVSFASAAKYSHATALSKIQAAGLTISSSGGCSDRNNPTCTSLEQVNSNSIDTGSGGITTFKRASGCAVRITGGTEVGHASGTYSHWNGYKIDIGVSTCIDNYIRNSYTFIGNRPGDGAPQYQSAAGNIYAKEGNHWDILYY